MRIIMLKKSKTYLKSIFLLIKKIGEFKSYTVSNSNYLIANNIIMPLCVGGGGALKFFGFRS